jgi:hypothetical protein
MPEIFNEITEQLDEIVSIEYIGVEDTIDINTTGNRLFYANGILTHNSAVEEVEFDHSMISGGISKINTADNVFGIFTSRAMRERGKYQLQLMKTRSSAGVGQKIDLDFDVDTLRIFDGGGNANGHSSSPSNIMNSIKTRSTVSQQPQDSLDTQTDKLNSLFNKIKS